MKSKRKQSFKINLLKKSLYFLYYLFILFFAFAIFTTVVYIFSPATKFSATTGSNQWFFTFSFNGQQSIRSPLSFKILQNLPIDFINPKAAMIMINSLKVLPTYIFILVGLRSILSIINDLLSPKASFKKIHVKKIKLVAFLVMSYYLFFDLILSIGFIYISNIFCLDLYTIHITGFFIGSLIYLISEIFNYALFLQNEYDTTL